MLSGGTKALRCNAAKLGGGDRISICMACAPKLEARWFASMIGAMRKSIYTSEYAILCQILREVRRDGDLSQRDLALRLGVSPSWVAKVEIGERRIDLLEFTRFVAACGSDPEILFSDLARRLRVGGKGQKKKGGR